MGVRLHVAVTAAKLEHRVIRKAFGVAVTTAVTAAVVALAAWFVLAAVAGATLVTFRTGSMAPTMPQGAVAVTLPTAAEALVDGDVVTIERGPDALPITHRVVEVQVPADASDPRLRSLVLQGDANASPDAQPYLVTDVRRVVLSAPHVGSALMVLQSPIGMGALTVLAGVLATWAFWPRREGVAEAGQVDDTAAHDAPAEASASGAAVPSTAGAAATARTTTTHPTA